MEGGREDYKDFLQKKGRGSIAFGRRARIRFDGCSTKSTFEVLNDLGIYGIFLD